MNNVSKNVLAKIEKEHIKPIPKWQFIFGHIVLWVAFVLSIVIGSIAISISLFKIFSSDWEVIPRIPGGPVLILPYLWIGLMALMVFLASKIFTKTEEGYKISPWIAVIASVIVSFILGTVLFTTSAAEMMENAMLKHIKPYQQYQELREVIFHAPENGVLPGRIFDMNDDVMIILDDFSGKRWEVDIIDARIPKLGRPLKINQIVIVIGEKTGESEFKADGVKPGNVLKNRLSPPLPKKGLIK